jgi:hypothetical protein
MWMSEGFIVVLKQVSNFQVWVSFWKKKKKIEKVSFENEHFFAPFSGVCLSQKL